MKTREKRARQIVEKFTNEYISIPQTYMSCLETLIAEALPDDVSDEEIENVAVEAVKLVINEATQGIRKPADYTEREQTAKAIYEVGFIDGSRLMRSRMRGEK